MQEIAGRVTVSASDAISAHLLPDIVARIRRQAPQITLVIVASNSISDLRRREADIAIRHVRPTEPELIEQMCTNPQHKHRSADPSIGRHGGYLWRRHGVGPTLGGFLASWLGWRWIFFAIVSFCVALALAVPRLVAETKDPEGRPLDPVAVALQTMSLGLAIDALLRRDGSFAVRAVCLVGSATAAFLFAWQQWRSPRPVRHTRNRECLGVRPRVWSSVAGLDRQNLRVS